jgi:hypothetical protein
MEAWFRQVWASKSSGVVLVGIKSGMWRNRKGCVEAKQLREECVAVRYISYELIHFAPG